MQVNVGNADRLTRIAIGTFLLLLILILPGYFKWLSLLGLIPLFTAFVRWCPLYSLLGLTTRSTPKLK